MASRQDATNRATLTPRTVVEGALALADAEGLGAVSIRRLAKELGVTPMALYWHFGSKDKLLDGMAARLFEEVEFSISLVPVFIGEGIRLFDGIDRRKVSPEIVEAIHSPLVTHLRYAVTKH